MNSIGLFGGTFNPIHLGHLQVAEEVRAGFGLEKIIFIPSAIPPHKGTSELADANDRYKMIVDAISENPKFIASDVEIKRPGRSYTIDTVTHYKNNLPKETSCYLIVGLDAFFEIDTWKSYHDFFELIPMIVMTRPSEETNELQDPCKAMEIYIRAHVSDGYRFLEHKSCFVHSTKQAIYLFNVTPIDISSSKIRKYVKQGASIKNFVSDAVGAYILKKGLYI